MQRNALKHVMSGAIATMPMFGHHASLMCSPTVPKEATMRWLIAALIASTGMLAARGALSETVRIAAEDDWAPYSSIKADKSGPEGFAVDIVREAFKTQGVDVEFVAVPFARCLHYAETGVTAGCFNATIIEGNRDTFHWHPTPLFSEELAIFSHAQAGESAVTMADLEGRTVGYTLGYTYPTGLMENPKITRFATTSDDQLIQMVAAKRVDFVLLNEMPGYLRISRIPGAAGKVRKVGTISMDGFWIAFSKAHPDGERLSATFEAGLQSLKNSGRYAELEAGFRSKLGL